MQQTSHQGPYQYIWRPREYLIAEYLCQCKLIKTNIFCFKHVGRQFLGHCCAYFISWDFCWFLCLFVCLLMFSLVSSLHWWLVWNMRALSWVSFVCFQNGQIISHPALEILGRLHKKVKSFLCIEILLERHCTESKTWERLLQQVWRSERHCLLFTRTHQLSQETTHRLFEFSPATITADYVISLS